MSQSNTQKTLDKVFLISGITVSALVIIVYIVFLIPIIFNKTKLSYLSFLKSHLIICSIICQTYLILYSLCLLGTFDDCMIIVIARTLSMFPIMCNSTFIAMESFFILIKGTQISGGNRGLSFLIFFIIAWLPVLLILGYIFIGEFPEPIKPTCAIGNETFKTILTIVTALYYLLMLIFYIRIIVFLCTFNSRGDAVLQEKSKQLLKTIWLYIIGFIILLFFVSFTGSSTIPPLFVPVFYVNIFGFSCLLPFINWIYVWSQKMKNDVLQFYCGKKQNTIENMIKTDFSDTEINSGTISNELDVSREN